MSAITFKLKTHSREDITEQFDNLNNCVVHNCKPKIFKIVAGNRKEVHYIAVCEHGDCGKITMEENEIDKVWNKWNQNKPT